MPELFLITSFISLKKFHLFHLTFFSGIHKNESCILLADNHPKTVTDDLWELFFPCLVRIFERSRIGQQSFVNKLLLRPKRDESVVLQKGFSSLNVLSALRKEAYLKLNIPLSSNPINCNFLRVLIVWRRDYQNHPGNKEQIIDRKISNEDEVLQTFVNKLSFVNISDVQLEQLPVSEQIRLVSSVDVFWGIHGAGHAISIFMRPRKVVVELMPVTHVSYHFCSNMTFVIFTCLMIVEFGRRIIFTVHEASIL